MNEASQDPPPKAGWRKILSGVLRFGIGATIFALVIRWLAPDWDALAERVELVPSWVLVGFVGTTLASVVTAARWKVLAELMGGTPLPYISYFYGLVVTRFIGQFTSTMGMDLVGRGLALQSAGSEKSLGHAATQVVLERLLDLALPVVLLGWAFAAKAGWLGIPPLLSLLLFAGVFFVLAVPLLRPGVRVALWSYLGLKRTWRGWRGRPESVTVSEATTPAPVDHKIAASVALFSLARFATVILQFWGIGRAVGLDLSFVDMSMATPVAQLAGMLGFTPGALGILEVGWAGGLGWVGFGAVAISLFVLAQRVGVITFFGLLSAISWPFARRAAQARRNVAAQLQGGEST